MENYGITTPKTMLDTVASLYESTEKILSVHCRLNEIAMSVCQSIGYNGFKRWHRCRCKEFMKLKLSLATQLYDEFRLTPTFKEYELSYSPSSLEEHLRTWETALSDGIKDLGIIYKQYYDTVGRCCKSIEKANKLMLHDYEKVGKLIKRFTESDWLTLDMHIVDDSLHEKYKHKEKKCNEYC